MTNEIKGMIPISIYNFHRYFPHSTTQKYIINHYLTECANYQQIGLANGNSLPPVGQFRNLLSSCVLSQSTQRQWAGQSVVKEAWRPLWNKIMTGSLCGEYAECHWSVVEVSELYFECCHHLGVLMLMSVCCEVTQRVWEENSTVDIRHWRCLVSGLSNSWRFSTL